MEVQRNDPGSDPPTHRRKGGAFDQLARIFNKVSRIAFERGFIFENRQTPQSTVSDNVLELYPEKRPDKPSLLFLGRHGLYPDKGAAVDTTVLAANIDSERDQTDPLIRNYGRIELTLFKDGQAATPQFIIVDGRQVGAPEGTSVSLLSAVGDDAIQIAAGETVPDFAIVLDKTGIQMFGLPTSDPSPLEATGHLWNSSGTLKVS